MSNYPSNWDKEKIDIWEIDILLTSQINSLFCQLSLAGKKRMTNLLKIELEDLINEQRIEKDTSLIQLKKN